MKTNPRYWQTLPDPMLYQVYKNFESLRSEPKHGVLPRNMKSLHQLMQRTGERKGIELIVYQECLRRQLITNEERQ